MTNSKMAYNYLKESIITNRLKPGEPLSESAMSRELGVSRTPIREAFKMLEKENLLSVFPNKGAIITSICLRRIQEIFQIREILEGAVASLVTPIISHDRLSQIEEQLRAVNLRVRSEKNKHEAIKISGEAVPIGLELHTLIFETFGNLTLISFLEGLKIDMIRGCDFASRNENAYKFLIQHLEIIAAFKKRNSRLAGELMSKHIRDARIRL